jgi:hypothetical protein
VVNSVRPIFDTSSFPACAAAFNVAGPIRFRNTISHASLSVTGWSSGISRSVIGHSSLFSGQGFTPGWCDPPALSAAGGATKALDKASALQAHKLAACPVLSPMERRHERLPDLIGGRRYTCLGEQTEDSFLAIGRHRKLLRHY